MRGRGFLRRAPRKCARAHLRLGACPRHLRQRARRDGTSGRARSLNQHFEFRRSWKTGLFGAPPPRHSTQKTELAAGTIHIPSAPCRAHSFARSIRVTIPASDLGTRPIPFMASVTLQSLSRWPDGLATTDKRTSPRSSLFTQQTHTILWGLRLPAWPRRRCFSPFY